MTGWRRRGILAAAAALAVGATLTACTGQSPDAAPSVAESAAGPSIAAPETTATPASETPDPTCENIIPQATADDFTSLGWASQEEPFRIGATTIDDGIQCKWGDQKIASDRVQIFGWAPIDDATAVSARNELVASGWQVEVDADGTYVTENPEWLGGRGVDGYGLTYLFGEGWVKLADTRQSLILVDAPRQDAADVNGTD
ncbi:hypothetical protein M3672_07920 [Microbacterium enclense]|uniref:Nitrate ABC transporter substrate-binding protein n=1 Tax=Microbacterium enclense TaxID=993073 RepID=A0A1G6HEI0_9MICO|nr:hypothetical protein [Microbacterium enclense]KSU55262.1 hypothetical protein AS029_04310 [Microbacterium enclense]MCM3614367.1 hypothetical protein [Microbacterium enclense]SDB92662.1 hypothetical protein SAMN05216418_1111 [Microbacterium enclense]